MRTFMQAAARTLGSGRKTYPTAALAVALSFVAAVAPAPTW